MTRYIDADARNESICRNCFHAYVCEKYNKNRDTYNNGCHFANGHYVPTADVVEVRHGRWIHKPVEDDDTLILPHCSECNSVSARERNYCPNCGAKMDGVDADD
ncbi:MAG: hypothetical protein IKY46_07875 [Clostridia bacterium]|nr:hypothetical protein [Clostridia bacterium]MBR5903831.1 hypothetical protein [Clostridia bacterium]